MKNNKETIEKLHKVIEVCKKIKDIEDKKREVAMKDNQLYDPSVRSWTQVIESIVYSIIINNPPSKWK